MSKILIGLCALTLLVVTPSVKADPLVVTSGSLSVTGIASGPKYTFNGANFSITGSGGDFGNVRPQSCFPCVSGDLLEVDAVLTGTSLGLGSATINGTTFNNVVFTGSLTFLGDPVLIPAATTNITLTTPFTFTGNVFGCTVGVGSANCGQSTALFNVQLVGQGIVTINLNFLQLNANGQSIYFFRDVTYTFTDVPEPVTLILLTTGVVGLGAKLKLGGRRR